MHGLAPSPLFAAIAIPTAKQCLMALAPLLALAGGRWLFVHLDEIIHRLFPTLEWNRELGWLNIRAERRASAFFRWVAYVVYAVLAIALAGIAWGAVAFREIQQWSDPMVMGDLLLRLPVLAACLGLWLFYLGADLLPQLRREYEREDLEKFRAQLAALEESEGAHPGSRLKTKTQIWSKSPLPQRPRFGR